MKFLFFLNIKKKKTQKMGWGKRKDGPRRERNEGGAGPEAGLAGVVFLSLFFILFKFKFDSNEFNSI